jgi:hypothetical protein
VYRHNRSRPRFRLVPYIRGASVLLGAVVLGNGWAAGSAPSGIEACAQIADEKQRLACFDREIVLQKQRAPVAAPATTPSAPPAAPELPPEQRMGLSPGKILQLQPTRAPDLKELTAKIQQVSANGSGLQVFTLDNGQVWQQIETDTMFAVRPGDTVRITKALLGSYFMSANAHMSTRVSRSR